MDNIIWSPYIPVDAIKYNLSKLVKHKFGNFVIDRADIAMGSPNTEYTIHVKVFDYLLMDRLMKFRGINQVHVLSSTISLDKNKYEFDIKFHTAEQVEEFKKYLITIDNIKAWKTLKNEIK